MEVDPKQIALISSAKAWIASRIRDVRLARGMTQKELSNRMAITYTRVSDLENNISDYKISSLLRAAWGLGVSLEDLMSGCPGWKSKAAIEKTMIIVEHQRAHHVLVSSGVSAREADRICARLLDESRS
jgi:transcriptional regulator with XRE-family HTH domain